MAIPEFEAYGPHVQHNMCLHLQTTMVFMIYNGLVVIYVFQHIVCVFNVVVASVKTVFCVVLHLCFVGCECSCA